MLCKALFTSSLPGTYVCLRDCSTILRNSREPTRGLVLISCTTFHYPADFSPEAFFLNYYGVLCPPDSHPQRIVIRAYYPFAHYLHTLPLHRTQTVLLDTPEYTDFELYLCPTFDFKQELLAQGKDVEVLQPASLREDMKQMLREAMGRYKE